MNESKKANNSAAKSPRNIRQWILVGILVFVSAAYLYDRYVLMPAATAKINKVLSEVTLRISEENRKQIHEIVGIKPASSFKHAGFEVEQYRFPRGLPFFHRPVLDVAYEGDTMAFYRQTPMDNAFIESRRNSTIIDKSLREETGEHRLNGFGG